LSDEVLAVLIFGLTYLAIISERVPKTAAALAGAALMIAVKLEGYDQRQAFAAIDLNVIFLLAGMMIIVNIVAKTGVFPWLAVHSAHLAGGSPLRILVLLSLVTAVLSAFLDNVTVVVFMAPITIYIAGALEISAVPFLISEALASNVGGTATLIGDPPNILVGSAADLDFGAFVTNLAPVIVLILALYLLLVPLLFAKQLAVHPDVRARIMAMDRRGHISDYRLLWLSMAVLALTFLGFLLHGVLHYEPATVALLGAAVLLILSRQDPHEILREVEWSTLFFFVGLFVVVGGLDWVGLLSDAGEKMSDLTGGNTTAASMAVLWVSGILSGVVDNIPYTTAMIPVVREMGVGLGGNGGPGDVLWWSLALGACLGGNLTIVAASANVLVAHLAERSGQRICFWEFFRYGSLVTLLSLAVSSLYIWLRYLL
jgi:Na+/H+ antiporter NhaD/arsenite permease-like protein